jgi:CheY-like chemotaxis protein
VASDGHECLDIVQGENFDAILMDCHMPKMDGFQATRAIRALEASGVMTRKLARRKKRLRRARSVLPASQANSAGDDDAECSNETTAGRVNKNDNISRREANVDDDDDDDEDDRDGLSSPSAEVAGFSSGDGPPAPPETDVRLRGAGRKAERRRWLKGVQGVPIIALTASATSDVQRQCLECGMNDFLQKPFQKEDFVQVLQEWATRGGGAIPPSAERQQEGARSEGARSPALEG